MRLYLIAAAVVTLAAAGPTAADNTQLVGIVGPGYTITLDDSSGAKVTHLDPGTYTLVVHDKSDIHNFHLFGPGGVDAATDVDFVGDKTFTVNLVDGTYNYDCDAHPGSMKGSFTVGSAPTPTTTATPPPPAPRSLTLAVGTGRVTAPAHAHPGRYVVTVRDASTKENVHLIGPGVNRKTSAAFKGTAHWTITLKKGKYRAYSDAHKSLARTISVP